MSDCWRPLILRCNQLFFVTVRFLFLLKPFLLFCLPKELPPCQGMQIVLVQWSPRVLFGKQLGSDSAECQYLLRTPESLYCLVLSAAEATQHLRSLNPSFVNTEVFHCNVRYCINGRKVVFPKIKYYKNAVL